MRILSPITVEELDRACVAWLANPENKFFPKPGELLVLGKPKTPEGGGRVHQPSYRAPEIDHIRAKQEREELDEFFRTRMVSP